MDAGPSLYRRHRPRTFAEVVGQEHVVRTLRNAITQGQVHHAYLFVGSRGTGKTSMAKMLAACLNCERGPTVEPCGSCDSCRSIAAATSLDVVEMDAASHNGVDDIRELREAVQYAPVAGRSKVYILDEAHMLSTQAWNAFLKTLEEPPPNTIFVLATTEAHKVMATVVDRCHRFDFHRPSISELTTVIGRVAAQEGITVAPEATALIARAATGSYRDALGMLEQIVTYSGKEIGAQDVAMVVGAPDDELLFGAIDAIAAGDAPAAWRIAERLADTGRDARRFLVDLEKHARDVLVVQTLHDVPQQLAFTPERDTLLRDQATRATGAATVRLLDLIAAASRLVKDGADAQTQLEIALVKAASPQYEATTRALLARLERVEQAMAGQAPVPAPPATQAANAAAPAPVPPPAPVTPPPAQAAPQPAPEPAAPPATAQAAIDLGLLTELWPGVIEAVTEQHGLLGASYAAGRPIALDGRELTIAFPAERSFERRKAEAPEARNLAVAAIRSLTGGDVRLLFETAEPAAAAPQPGEPAGEDAFLARLRSEFDAVDADSGAAGQPATTTPDTDGA